jgi:hypothetical protein
MEPTINIKPVVATSAPNLVVFIEFTPLWDLFFQSVVEIFRWKSPEQIPPAPVLAISIPPIRQLKYKRLMAGNTAGSNQVC